MRKNHKTMKTYFKIIILISLCTHSIMFSQPVGHWILGGNGSFPPVDDVTPPGKNFLGTIAPFNVPISMGVNGRSDIWVDNLNGAPQIYSPANFLNGGHWVGMGGVFGPGQPPLAHLHITGLSTIGFAGVRTWMQTGTLYSENSDGMYSSETFYILA